MKYYYLDKESNFTEANLKANRSSVLQLKWCDGRAGKERLACLNEYSTMITALFHSVTYKEASYQEKRDKLKDWLDELRRKYPKEYLIRELGWYDLPIQKEIDARIRWRSLPVDYKLTNLAKKEGRVSFIVRRQALPCANPT